MLIDVLPYSTVAETSRFNRANSLEHWRMGLCTNWTGCLSFSFSLLISRMFLGELMRFNHWQSIPEIKDYCGAFGRTYTIRFTQTWRTYVTFLAFSTPLLVFSPFNSQISPAKSPLACPCSATSPITGRPTFLKPLQATSPPISSNSTSRKLG